MPHYRRVEGIETNHCYKTIELKHCRRSKEVKVKRSKFNITEERHGTQPITELEVNISDRPTTLPPIE